MSLLDNDYDFDAMESTIDFKVEWHDPINHIKGENDMTQFRLLKDMSVSRLGGSLIILFDKNNIDILKKYITKLKEYYKIYPPRIDVDGLYNYIEDYVLGVSINDNIIELYIINGAPCLSFHFYAKDDHTIVIKGALENAIFYNVLCEIEKGLDQVVYL